MDYLEIIKKIEPEMEKIVAFFEEYIKKYRTATASPALVEDIMVDCFGQRCPLKQLSAISCPEPRKIVIQPWDKTYLEPIEKALFSADLGMNPIVDKDLIRLSLPSLSEEHRNNLLQSLSQKAEESRVSIKQWREKAWKEIQDKTREGEIREDDKFRAKDKLQELVDEYNKKIEQIGERKKKEILE
ncbi:MAG: ribosome recycling factor [Candidatus Pacebacteria bacterium]|nr:ribosome recycling factor [Candidatus Paceibacterota bacterium]